MDKIDFITAAQWHSQGGQGGKLRSPAHWHAEYEKYHFFSTLILISALELENSPPPPYWHLQL